MSAALPLLLDMSLKAILLCAGGLLARRLAAQHSAALKHDILLAALACVGLLPAIALLLWVFDFVPRGAVVHHALIGATPNLPVGMPGGAVEILDRVWSGNGGMPQPGWTGGLVVGIWLSGAGIAILRNIISYRAAAAIVRRAGIFPSIVFSRGIRILITAELSAPAVFGVRKPAILLPREAQSWPADRLEAVFAHEAAHIERRDCLLEILVQFACVMHWYNPLVRHAARYLRIDRELACDEHAVSSGLNPSAYAAALVQVARTAFRTAPGPMLAMARRPELERRIVTLLTAGPQASRQDGGTQRLALTGAAVALFIPVAAFTTPASGAIAPGSVQPASGPLRGLDNPMSERAPLPYESLAPEAAAVAASGPERHAIIRLKAELDRPAEGYGDLVRERAIWALTQVRDGSLFAPIAAHVGDHDWRLRAYAAWGLAATGDRRATALLVPMLRDPVWRVRAMAADALAAIADPRAGTAMADALDDAAWQVRISAVAYIDKIGDPILKRRLLPLRRDPHFGTRTEVERVLSQP